jgi:hypothetical protein
MQIELEDDFVHDPPAGESADDIAAWQERAYFSLHRPDGLALDIGCGRHPIAGGPGSFSAYACLGTPEGAQANVRAAGPLAAPLGVPDAKPFRFEILDPLRSWRIGLETDALSADLNFEACSPMWALPKTEIGGKRGATVSSQICFQAGTYNGHIEVAGERLEVENWRGLRDRTWGVRRFEGRLPSGLMVAAMFSMEDHGLMLWSVERRTGERVVSNGARLFPDGTIREVLDWSVELEFGAGVGRLIGGDLTVVDEAGTEDYRISSTNSTIYLAGGGYLEKGRHGAAVDRLTVDAETWNTAEDDVLAAISGLDDHVVTLDGDRQGSGVLEIQLGKHERYRPEGWTEAEERVSQGVGA